MTDFTEANKILDRTAVIKNKCIRAICTICEYCNGIVVGNVGSGSDAEIITDYICTNPAKTGDTKTGIPVKHPLTCTYKHKATWASDTRPELIDENNKLKVTNKLINRRISELETKLDAKDQYIEELQKLLKSYEHECFQEKKNATYQEGGKE